MSARILTPVLTGTLPGNILAITGTLTGNLLAITGTLPGNILAITSNEGVLQAVYVKVRYSRTHTDLYNVMEGEDSVIVCLVSNLSPIL